MKLRVFAVMFGAAALLLAGLVWYVAGDSTGAGEKPSAQSNYSAKTQRAERDMEKARGTDEANARRTDVEDSAFAEADREIAAAHANHSPAKTESEAAQLARLDWEMPYPLAFRAPSPALNLDERQLAAMDSIRHEFAHSVGEGQNPQDPEYKERWEAARPLFDQKLQALLGTDVYLALEREANAERISLSTQGN